MMEHTTIHKTDALSLLKDGEPHKLKLWKKTTGDILLYKDALYIGEYKDKGIIRVKLINSNEIRSFRFICLFEIDDLKIYL